jgi:hypothetical protein
MSAELILPVRGATHPSKRRYAFAKGRAVVAPLSVPCYNSFMRNDSFSAIDDLILQAELAAAAKPNQVRLVAELVGLVADGGTDPYLLIGALVEGAVDTLAKHIPTERQVEATEQLGRFLVQRLKARGLA